MYSVHPQVMPYGMPPVAHNESNSLQLVENPHTEVLTDDKLLRGFREQLDLESQEQSAVEPIMPIGKGQENMVRKAAYSCN